MAWPDKPLHRRTAAPPHRLGGRPAGCPQRLPTFSHVLASSSIGFGPNCEQKNLLERGEDKIPSDLPATAFLHILPPFQAALRSPPLLFPLSSLLSPLSHLLSLQSLIFFLSPVLSSVSPSLTLSSPCSPSILLPSLIHLHSPFSSLLPVFPAREGGARAGEREPVPESQRRKNTISFFFWHRGDMTRRLSI